MENVVSFEVAKLLKEKGWNIPTLCYYFEDGVFVENKLKEFTGMDYGSEYTVEFSELLENWNDKFLTKKNGDRCFGCKKSIEYFETYSAPTQSLAQKFLREKYCLNINIKHKPTSQTYGYSITGLYDKDNDYIVNKIYHKFETYEFALEDALLTCLSKDENGKFIYIKLEK